jgi:flagellar basal body-associated protein FliL
LNTVRSEKQKRRPVLERILLDILITLLAVIVLGTVWALIAKPGTALVPMFKAKLPDDADPVSQPEQRVFTGIGRLRVPLAASAGKNTAHGNAAAVITIVFPYDATGKDFLEELSMNVGKFRAIAADYLKSLPADSPLLKDEQTLKHDLLSRYNKLLHLGKIEALYFPEFIIIN